MKHTIILFFCAVWSIYALGQSDRRNVLQSDISPIYKNAVKKAYYGELNRNYSLSKGYHGMVDFGYTFGIGDYDFGRFEINTSHGYQFNPYFFLGGGFGIHFMSEYSTPSSSVALDCRQKFVDIPLFVNGRVTFIENNITPYIDGRVGYYVTDSGGIYASVSVGCRFATWSRQAVNISFGYSHENLQFRTFDHFISNNLNYTRYSRNLGTNCLNIKVGYEF